MKNGFLHTLKTGKNGGIQWWAAEGNMNIKPQEGKLDNTYMYAIYTIYTIYISLLR